MSSIRVGASATLSDRAFCKSPFVLSARDFISSFVGRLVTGNLRAQHPKALLVIRRNNGEFNVLTDEYNAILLSRAGRIAAGNTPQPPSS